MIETATNNYHRRQPKAERDGDMLQDLLSCRRPISISACVYVGPRSNILTTMLSKSPSLAIAVSASDTWDKSISP